MPLTAQEIAKAAGIAAAEYHKNEMAKWIATNSNKDNNTNPNIKSMPDYTPNYDNIYNPYYKTPITQVQGPSNNINIVPTGNYTNARITNS